MKLKTDIRQRHLEKFEELYNAIETKGVSSDSGKVLRAAIEAGWYTDCDDPVAVDDMRGGEVRKLAQAVNDLYLESIRIDPN